MPNGNVKILYSPDLRETACKVRDFLESEHDARVVKGDEEGCVILYAEESFCRETAIILISDGATQDSAWQENVRSLSGETRLIPVGKIVDADYHDPEVVPAAIEELNFIKIDEKMLQNIWSVMITDSVFFPVLNRVQIQLNTWKMSGCSDIFLMNRFFSIAGCLKQITVKLSGEKDPEFRRQLEEMAAYLVLSEKMAVKEFFSAFRRNLIKFLYIAAAVLLLIVLFYVHPIIKRGARAASLLNAETDTRSAPIMAVRLLDGLENPFLNNAVKNRLITVLQDCLNMNWYDAPTGLYYKWYMYSARPDHDSRYLWTAGENGQLVKWDTYTGNIAERVNVSASPLVAMDTCGMNRTICALDAEGNLFLVDSGADGAVRLLVKLELPDVYSADIHMAEDGGTIAVWDTGKIYRIAGRALWTDSADEILCADVSGDEVIWLSRGGEDIYVNFTAPDGQTKREKFDITFAEHCNCGIRDGKLLYADQYGQIMTADLKSGAGPETTGLLLREPLMVSFVSDKVIAYHDRNVGTHIYDLEHQLDLGSVLNLYPLISRLYGEGSTVVGFYAGRYLTEDISRLLPREAADAQEVTASFSGLECGSDEGDIHSIKVMNRYLLLMDCSYNEENVSVLIDGANRRSAGNIQQDPSIWEGVPENYFSYTPEVLKFTGEPTVVGITGGGNVALVGASDGSFFELVYQDGKSMLCSQRRVPSHSPILRIGQTEDGYLLEDAAGILWWARSGSQAVLEDNSRSLLREIKERIHLSCNQDMDGWISKALIRELGLTTTPDNSGKEWE